MANITLRIPDELYELMKEFKEVNWSEIARRAILRELLKLKARKRGLTRKEVLMYMSLIGMSTEIKAYGYDKEIELLNKIKEREKYRLMLLSELEKGK